MNRKCLHVLTSPSPTGCWFSFPLGRAGKDPGKAFLKGFICSCVALFCLWTVVLLQKSLSKQGSLLSLHAKPPFPLKSAESELQPSTLCIRVANLTLLKIIVKRCCLKRKIILKGPLEQSLEQLFCVSGSTAVV